MASGKEITGKIKSVENTKKVTSALEMVSASKIRKSQDLMRATEIARRMVVEYGFGDLMQNKSLVALGDFALTSGVEILDDIQRIIDGAKEASATFISDHKDVHARLVDALVDEVLMNSDALTEFFNENPLD